VSERPYSDLWSERYRKFLGDFIRRHHARLAHEIALFGFPSAKQHGPTLDGLPRELADLSGFVARSHNISLRDCYRYLDGRYSGHVICYNTHPVFLMVLLRIADISKSMANRVNRGWAGVQHLASPISHEEWAAHLAVQEVRPDDADPESLFSELSPVTHLHSSSFNVA